MVKIITRIITALCIGACISLWIVQNTPSVQQYLCDRINDNLERQWNTTITAQNRYVNLFTCSLLLDNGTIKPKDAQRDYSWQFKTGRIRISPWQLLVNKSIVLSCTFNHLKAHTRHENGTSDILLHIYDIFGSRAPGGYQIRPANITINNAVLTVKNAGHELQCLLPGTFFIGKASDTSRDSARWRGNYHLKGGSIYHNNELVINNAQAMVSYSRHKTTGNWDLGIDGTLESPLLTTQTPYKIKGTWHDRQGTVLFNDKLNTTALMATLPSLRQVQIKGHLPLALPGLQQFVATDWRSYPSTSSGRAPACAPLLQGVCNLDVSLGYDNGEPTASGTIIINDTVIGTLPIKTVGCKLSTDQQGILHTALSINQSPATILIGKGSVDWHKQSARLTVYNKTGLASLSENNASTLTPFIIRPSDFLLKLHASPSDITGSYQCTITNQITERAYPYKGTFAVENNTACVNGTSAKGAYQLKAGLKPHPHITQWTYAIGDKKYLDLQSDAKHSFVLKGQAAWPLIKSFLDQSTRRLILGNQCVFDLHIDQRDLSDIAGSITMTQGRLHIPDYYNLIQGAQANLHFNTTTKQLDLDHCAITMSKGSIVCPWARFTLDDNYQLKTAYAPLQINNMFVNWHKDFFGVVYGNLIINKAEKTQPIVSGSLALKKSILKGSLFTKNGTSSPELTGGIPAMPDLAWPCALDIAITTQNPLKVKTPALEALALLDLKVKTIDQSSLFHAPSITGTITLNGGYLRFLQHNLHIEHGTIQFLPNNFNNPIIELIAKNRINKYAITLQATGSLQRPTMALESTPELTEEQILGLLFLGSEKVTLQSDLPAMLLCNLDSLFLNTQTSPKMNVFLDTLGKTFKYVQITPDLSQASTSKVKGAISVNLTPQLRAQIQKSFDAEKDFSARLEYALSDNVNFSVVKDQRGELGSEVEFRLKL